MAKSSAAVQRKEQRTKGGEVATIEGDKAREMVLDGEVGHLPAGFTMNGSVSAEIVKAEIDQQIATARRYPRDIKMAMQNINTLATLDQQTAEGCIYALPRGGTPIKGPSIRLAEIIMQNWGNCRAGSRVIHVDRDEMYVEAEGQFHDLQTNALRVARTRRPIRDKNGRCYNDDMIVMTSNAAQAIAIRNAILASVPRGVWRQAYDAAEAVLTKSVKPLSERRAGAMKVFSTWGITGEQLLEKLGRASIEEITNQDVVLLVGLHTAIKNQETTVEEEFKVKPPAPGAKPVDNKVGNKPTAEKQQADAAQAGADTKTGELPADEKQVDGDAPNKPESPFALGRKARQRQLPYRPPEGLTEKEADEWKEGWSFEDEEIAAQRKTQKP